MAELYLGHWEWQAQGLPAPFHAWRAPGGDALSCFDLRTLPDRGTPGPLPRGVGLFTYDAPRSYPQLLMRLGPNPERLLTAIEKSGLRTLLGLPATAPLADSLGAALRQLLLDPALYDPTGQNRWKPLRGNPATRRVEWAIRGMLGPLISEVFSESHPAFAARLAVRHADYRRNRLAVDQGLMPFEALQRWTGHEMRALYGRMGDDLLSALLPPEFEADGWLPPRTTLTDNFARADSAALGTSSEGWSWTEYQGTDWAIEGEQASLTGSAGVFQRARAESDLSTDDHYCQATLSVWTRAAGSFQQIDVQCRKDSTTTNTSYIMRAVDNDGVLSWVVDQQIAGTNTTLISDPLDPALNDVMRVTAGADDNIHGTVNGVELSGSPVVDTGITGNLRCGILGTIDNAASDLRLDNWSAADVEAAATSPQRTLMGVGT